MIHKYLLDKETKNLPTPFVVVCEGMGDARFLCALLDFKGITNCRVGCPSPPSGGSGFEAIPAYLKGLSTAAQRSGVALLGILVVVDANGEPDERFKNLASALPNANFPAPVEPFTIHNQAIRVGVFLIPGKGEKGTLEHLLLKATFKKTPALEKCVDDFSACAGQIVKASLNQQAKMKMSALAAVSCKDNPWTSLNLIWSYDSNPIPIDSECFKPLSDLLVQFTA